MELSRIVSAIYNDLVAGLSGYNANPTISMEQLEDEVVEKRQRVIKELYAQGALKREDLLTAINCVEVDCADPIKCCNKLSGKSELHFEIPQLMDDLGEDAVFFIGSADRKVSYSVTFSPNAAKNRKYRRRGKDKPYVYIEKTPNSNNMYDCWIYNLPFVKNICVIGIFKDLRQLEMYDCCRSGEYTEFGSISDEVKNRVIQGKFAMYRQSLSQPQPTNLIPR